MTSDELEARLQPSTLDLFDRLARVHLDSTGGGHKEFVWYQSHSIGAGDHDSLVWAGDGPPRTQFLKVRYDVSELIDVGLLVRSITPNSYRIPGEALRFYKDRAAREAPIERVESRIRRWLDDPDTLAVRHPDVARHLAEAFEAADADPLADEAIIAAGHHLRQAVISLAAQLVGYSGTSPDAAAKALTPWLQADGRLPSRHPELLVSLIAHTMKCVQHLYHLHDRRKDRFDDPGRDEIRRTCFLVAYVCYELVRLE